MIDVATWGWPQCAMLGWAVCSIVWAMERNERPRPTPLGDGRYRQHMRPIQIAAFDVIVVLSAAVAGGFFR